MNKELIKIIIELVNNNKDRNQEYWLDDEKQKTEYVLNELNKMI